jgi:DNA mismatch repair ATPase MutS
MQVGAFMQVMDQDARRVSQVTSLKLQMAGEVDDPVVLGGFPRSGLDAYVGKLVRAGHSVAVAMQDGDTERRLAEVIRVRCVLPAEEPNEQGTPEHGAL